MARTTTEPFRPPIALRITRQSGLLVLGFGFLSLVGCITTSSRMLHLADAVERDMPGLELHHEFGLTLGRMSLGLTKSIAKWSLDEEEQREFAALRGIKKVELATFEVRGQSHSDFPTRLQTSYGRRGWQTLARFRDDGELGWVLYRLEKQRLKNVLVMVLDQEELTLVRLGGRLDNVVSAALTFVRDEVLEEETPDELVLSGADASGSDPLAVATGKTRSSS